MKTTLGFKAMMVALLVTFFSLPLAAQTIKVTGTVVDSSDEPLTGATVMVKGTQDGASTDFDGKFTLNAPSNGTLVVSYVGYTTQEVKINGQTNLTIVLVENSTVLDEVVAVGYGTQKKVNMTGAVSSVKSDALEDRPINDVTTALAGLAPGLAVRNTGGATPGWSSIDIKVRGNGTLNNSSPLIVIDGVTGASLSDLNPQDIDNISILKDAASSAIYGSRAANGVILITTKQGKEGTAKLTYSGNLSIETVAHKFNIVSDYADFMEIQNQARINNGQAPRFSQGKIDEWRNDAGRNPRVYPNTDWQDHAYRDPNLVQTHNIGVSGGTKTIRYNMSLGMVHNPGMLNSTKYVRYQMRSNIEADIKSWLTAGMNVFGYMETTSPSADNAADGDAIFGGGGPINTTPGMNLYDKETNTYGGMQNPEDQNVSNYTPYRRQWFWREDHPNQHKRIMPKMYVRITPLKGLTIQGSYTYKFDYQYRNLIYFDRPLYRYVFNDKKEVELQTIYDGIARTQVRNYFYVTNFRTSDLTVNYNFKAFNDRLETTVLLGTSQEYQHYNESASNKMGQPSYDQTTQNAGTTNQSISGAWSEWSMRSWFGRVNFVWDDKYLFEANVRTDGSSYFSPERRWGWFPSVSGGWRVSEEHFMEESRDWLTNLKLRASYGSLGNNSGVNSYSWQSVYANQNYILGTGSVITGMAQTAISNYNLTWESTYVTNIGVDYGLFNNRLSGSFEWYNKDTKGILMSVPASLEHGTTSIPVTNAGRVNNKGVDFDIRWIDKIGNVSYNVGFNMGYVKNKLVSYGGQKTISGNYKYEEGKPISQIYVMDVDRIVRNQADLDYVESLVKNDPNYFSTFVKPDQGDFLYKDSNGDGKLDYDDRIEVGHGTTPTFTYGINLGAQWNNFDIQMLFQGTGHHDVFFSNPTFRFVAQHGWTLFKDVVDNQWTPENPNAKYPILRERSNGKNQIASTAFVTDASYLRCKNIQIGYTIPRNISQKFFVENLKVYTSIDNLFTITDFVGQDPEINYGVGYPLVRQFSFGLNVSF